MYVKIPKRYCLSVFCGIITKKTFKKLLSHLNDSSGHSRFVRYQGKATLFALQDGVAKGKSVT